MAFLDAYKGRRVLVTGDTGFKGSWLCEWLRLLGAQVRGYAHPEEADSLFAACGLRGRMSHQDGDVRDAGALEELVQAWQPEFVFHLAAQALVRPSYADPAGTFETNVMGVVRVLDAVRRSGHRCSVVVVTSDKCYHNREWIHGYREEDPLGGHDPYSASKGAAEIVTASYRSSFFSSGGPVALASARAGNVIGGGDWALDRIVPDCIRSLRENKRILVRNPRATRPWQHVLEPLSGYLWLAAKMDEGLQKTGQAEERLCGAFNFGPALSSNRTVQGLVEEILKHWPGQWEVPEGLKQPHEAGLLSLSIDKASRVLAWNPVWDFETCVARTVTWYREVHEGRTSALKAVEEHINAYVAAAAEAGTAWAK